VFGFRRNRAQREVRPAREPGARPRAGQANTALARGQRDLQIRRVELESQAVARQLDPARAVRDQDGQTILPGERL